MGLAALLRRLLCPPPHDAAGDERKVVETLYQRGGIVGRDWEGQDPPKPPYGALPPERGEGE